ncbi:MAG: hypothetical protein EXR62_06135 [Chloroflexi bacterium]|nr:hypothetical protein [Chloroflexota bacterium]
MDAQKRSVWFVYLGVLLMVGLVVSFMVQAAFAAPPAPATVLSPQIILDAAGLTGADDGSLDVGVEYVADSPPAGAGGGDLPACSTSAWNFYNAMRNSGYTGANDFIYANSLAWESDWKRAALGGSENSYVDNVDISYYCDHGSNGSVYFPWGHTDNNLVPGDCSGAWGDKDAEWIAFGTCLTLTDNQGWSNCMNGVHLILGYTTISYDADEGGAWADQMLGWKFLGIWFRQPKTVTQAWFTMCDMVQPSSVQARVLAEDSRHFGDYLHNRGGPAYGDIVDNTYFWLDHNCYKPEPALVDTSLLATIPAYQIVPRTVDMAYAQNIATTLGLTGTLATDGQVWGTSDTQGGVTRTLEINLASGGYVYQNLSQLWIPPAPGAPLSLPDPNEAVQLAGNFFLAAQSLPGAQYRDPNSVHSETEKVMGISKSATASLNNVESIVQQQGVDVMVAYGRSLSARTSTSLSQVGDVSVVGPGSSTKLYFGRAGGQSAGSLPDRPGTQQQLPVGLLGGSRDVQAAPGKNVQVQTADKTWNDFLQDHQLAVATVPLDADEIVRKPLSDTLAYYEQPHTVSQAEMIPVWVFRADFKKGGALLAADVIVYVPASPDYYPPDVMIMSPTNGATIRAGQVVDISATVSGPFAPFTYEWTSSVGGILGQSATITATLAPALHGDEASSQTLSIKVTNANGQVRTTSIMVNVQPNSIYLPWARK